MHSTSSVGRPGKSLGQFYSTKFYSTRGNSTSNLNLSIKKNVGTETARKRKYISKILMSKRGYSNLCKYNFPSQIIEN